MNKKKFQGKLFSVFTKTQKTTPSEEFFVTDESGTEVLKHIMIDGNKFFLGEKTITRAMLTSAFRKKLGKRIMKIDAFNSNRIWLNEPDTKVSASAY